MAEVADHSIGSEGIAGALLRSAPAVDITAPLGPQSTETVTVTWTYSSPVSKPQFSYRVQILNEAGTGVLYDSGAISGTATSFACPFVLSGGSTYRVKVICSDAVDTGSDFELFSADLTTISDFPEETTVGGVYEVAINGVGYRLVDNPERPYRRSTGQLQAPRLATGDTPFSEAIERYSFVGVGDWSRGAGQRTADREGSDPRAFWTSENVDPFTPGQISLLPATTEILASASGGLNSAVVASGHLFVRTATDTVKRMTSSIASPDTMTFTGKTIGGLVSDGTYWYAWDTLDEVYRGTNTTIGSIWCNLSGGSNVINYAAWCTDRLALAYTNGSSQAVISTISNAGTEEVVGGRFKYDNATIPAICAGDGYMWWAVNRTDKSVIYAWQLGSSDGAFIALEMPKGETVTELYFYLGNVMIRAARSAGATVYRAISSTGELTPERVMTMDGASADAGPFVGKDRFVMWGWTASADDGRTGTVALDLSTGAWARWIMASDAADIGDVTGMFVWEDKLGFVVDGAGVAFESSTLAASGYVESSLSDLGSGLVKVLDEITVSLEPLPATSSVQVLVSYDGAVSFTDAGTVSSTGVREGSFPLGRQGSSLATKIVLATSGVTSPKVKMAQVKLHPLSIVDSIVELPIDCQDRMTGVNGVEIQDNQPAGVARARVLESLVGSRVLFQDVDWPVTQSSEVWEMVSAEFTSVGVFSQLFGRRVESTPVCVCTLRKAQ